MAGLIVLATRHDSLGQTVGKPAELVNTAAELVAASADLDGGEVRQKLRAALAMLERVIKDHPESNEAVRLILDMDVGGLRRSEIRERLAGHSRERRAERGVSYQTLRDLRAAVRQRFIYYGDRSDPSMNVVMRVSLDEAGKFAEKPVLLRSFGGNESARKALYSAGRRALIKAERDGVFDQLPAQKNPAWTSMTFRFDLDDVAFSIDRTDVPVTSPETTPESTGDPLPGLVAGPVDPSLTEVHLPELAPPGSDDVSLNKKIASAMRSCPVAQSEGQGADATSGEPMQYRWSVQSTQEAKLQIRILSFDDRASTEDIRKAYRALRTSLGQCWPLDIGNDTSEGLYFELETGQSGPRVSNARVQGLQEPTVDTPLDLVDLLAKRIDECTSGSSECSEDEIADLEQRLEEAQSPEELGDPAEIEAELKLGRKKRRQLQRRLTLLGYSTRGVDGIFGPGTRAAISKWQEKSDLPVSGYFSGEQITKLEKASQSAYRAFLARVRKKEKRTFRIDRNQPAKSNSVPRAPNPEFGRAGRDQ